MTVGQGTDEQDDPIAALERLSETARLANERLTYELGHRVRNTLSVVQALANQSFRAAESMEGGLAAFSARIAALARANDAILREDWTRTTIDVVARSVLAPHGQTVGPCRIHGPAMLIGTNAALSFAMALHELATNARRHGAWSIPTGAVALVWTTSEGPAGQDLDLSWTETGGPPTSLPERRSFGLRFAEQSLRSAFGRDVVFDFLPTGLQCRIHAPPDALAA